MSTVTHSASEDVFVSAEELGVLFADAAQLYRERCGAWFTMQGYRRVVLLLAEHPTRHVFWLVAPAGEGRFLSMMGWTEAADALIDLDDQDWPERVPWKILARLPFSLVAPIEISAKSATPVSKPTIRQKRSWPLGHTACAGGAS